MSNSWITKSLKGTIIINQDNIIFGDNLSYHLRDAYRVLVGVDQETQILQIKSLRKEETNLTRYDDKSLLKLTNKKGLTTLGDEAYIRKLNIYLKLDFTRQDSFTFSGTWDALTKTLSIDFNKEVPNDIRYN